MKAESLASAIIGHAVDMAAYSNGMVRRIIGILAAAEADLVQALSAALERLPGSQFTVARLDTMLSGVRLVNAGAYARLDKDLSEQLRLLVEHEADFQVRLLRSVLADPDSIRPIVAEQAFVSAAEVPLRGRLMREWSSTLGDGVMRRLRDKLAIGFVEGRTVDEMVRQIRGTRAAGYADGVLGISRRDAEAVVRTAVAHFANTARDRVYQQNPKVIKAVEWIATLDTRTSEWCQIRDGKRYTLDGHRPIGHSVPWLAGPGRLHWNCVDGAAEVATPSPIRKLYRRAYEGELVTIETDGGRRVSVTPNHPVLTPTGWEPAANINAGDNVACHLAAGDVLGRRAPDHEGVNPTFEEVSEAARELVGVLPIEVPVSAPDFHGDVADQDVCEVSADGRLWDELHAALPKLLLCEKLKRADFDAPEPLPGPGHLLDGRVAADRADTGPVRRLDGASVVALPSGQAGLAAGPGDPFLGGPPVEGLEADADPAADVARVLGVVGIGFDRVTSVTVREWSGHVHNLENDDGWYLAGGVVCHNCRSTSIPVLDDKLGLGAGRTRASMDGPVSAKTTYADWLKRQSAARQDEILGPTRGMLMRKGQFTLDRFYDNRGRFLTLAQLRDRDEQTFKELGL